MSVRWSSCLSCSPSWPSKLRRLACASCPIPLDQPGTALASGEVDLAIGFFRNLTTGFRQSLLFREHYVCVVRADHPNFRSGMSAEAFAKSPRALADASGMAHTVVEDELKKQGLTAATATHRAAIHGAAAGHRQFGSSRDHAKPVGEGLLAAGFDQDSGTAGARYGRMTSKFIGTNGLTGIRQAVGSDERL